MIVIVETGGRTEIDLRRIEPGVTLGAERAVLPGSRRGLPSATERIASVSTNARSATGDPI